MKKSRSQEVRELPLFDLPLQADHEDGEEAVATPVERPARPQRPPAPRRPLPPPAVEVDIAEETAAADAGARPGVPTGERLAAGLVDFAVQVAALGFAAGTPVLLGIHPSLKLWPAFAVLALVFSFLYWVVPLAFWGQTPGMTWQGHLARSREDEALTFGQTARRWLGALLTAGLVGLPLVLASGGRSLSDRLSETKTVRVARGP